MNRCPMTGVQDLRPSFVRLRRSLLPSKFKNSRFVQAMYPMAAYLGSQTDQTGDPR